MAIVINTNISALKAQNSLRANNDKMAQAMERLSTGNRINGAKDDAAGMAIADRMLGKLNGFTVAIRNSNDAISMMQTAEGDMTQISINLQRIRELAIQSNNTTNSDTDRVSMQVETDQLVNEIQRIANASSFNGISLLNGDLQNASFQVGASNTVNDRITVSIGDIRTTTLGQSWREAHWATPSTLQGPETAKVSNKSLAAGDLSISLGADVENAIEIGRSTDALGASTNFKTADSAAAKKTAIDNAIGEVDAFYDVSVVATTKTIGVDKTAALNTKNIVEIDLSKVYSQDADGNKVGWGALLGMGSDKVVDGTIVNGDIGVNELTFTLTDPNTEMGTKTLTITDSEWVKTIDTGTTYTAATSESAAGFAATMNAFIAADANSGAGGELEYVEWSLVASAETKLVATVDPLAYELDTEADKFEISFQRGSHMVKDDEANVVTFEYDGSGETAYNTAMTTLASDISKMVAGGFGPAVDGVGKLTATWDANANKFTIVDESGEDIIISKIDAFNGTNALSSQFTNSFKTLTGLSVGNTKGTVRIQAAEAFKIEDLESFAWSGLSKESTTDRTVTINGNAFNVDSKAENYQQELVDQINQLDIGIEASIQKSTKAIELVAKDGRNIVVDFNSIDVEGDQLGLEEGTFRGSIVINSGNGKVNLTGAKSALGLTNAVSTTGELQWVEGSYKGGTTLDKVTIATLEGAQASVKIVDNAMDMVNQARATSGAYQNRFLAAVNNLSTAYTNLSAARSQIMDTDYATESTTLAKSQIVAQAATAMLAQANQSQQSVLALLK